LSATLKTQPTSSPVIDWDTIFYYIYADDTQLIGCAEISDDVIAVGDWCAFRRLQLNPSNTELIWFSLRVILRKIAANDLSLRVDNDVVTPVDAVILDPELTMQRHVNTVASACVCHIRRLKQIRRLLGPEVTATLISAFVLSRLDYCNAVLAGLPKVTIAPLQRSRNAAARLVLRLALHDHVTTALRHLQWLPVLGTILSRRHCHSDSISQLSWTALGLR